MDYDVFLSYPHSDATRVKRIVESLRAAGLRVWFDETDIADFQSITERIVEGLVRSKALVAWYSAGYMRSRACQWELTAAFLTAQREGDPRQRVLVVNPESGAEHIHPVELRDALFCKAPAADDAAALADLVASVKRHVGELPGTIGAIQPLTGPQWHGWRGVGSNRFVGRIPEMWKIHSGLQAASVPVITHTAGAQVVQLYGLGGTGKSLLAEEYALRFGAAYPGGVFWLRAYGNGDVKSGLGSDQLVTVRNGQLRDIAAGLGIAVESRGPEEIRGSVARKLGANGQAFLWMVDDLPSGIDAAELRDWFAPHPLGSTLITTRSREHDAIGCPVPLDALDPEDAYRLLTSRRAPADGGEAESAHAIARDLGYHALAIDVAGGVLKRKSFGQFQRDLADPGRDALELAKDLVGQLPNGHEKSIAATLLRSIELLDADGRDFLRLASGLAVAPIPLNLVAAAFALCDALDEKAASELAERGMHQAEQQSLSESSGNTDGAMLVHVLVSRTVRFRDPEPKRVARMKAAALHAFNARMPDAADIRKHAVLALWVAHAREIAVTADDAETATLLGWVARYDRERGDYRSASRLYAQERDIRRRVLGDEHPDTLTSMGNLAETLLAQGDLTGARSLGEKVLDTRRRVLGEEHPDTSATRNNLAQTLKAQGDLAGARSLLQKALEICRRVPGEEHPLTFALTNNLAQTLQAQGDLAGARSLLQKVLEVCRRVLGEEHPLTLGSMGNLAETLRAQGDLPGARSLQEKALQMRRRVLGEEHPLTFASMNDLANTLQAQGDSAGARSLHEKALETCHRALGEEHPLTLTSMGNLAETLRAQGDLPAARSLGEKVLDARRRVLGEEHPDTFASINNLAQTLQARGDLAGARSLHEKALETCRRMLGEEHPSTLTSMNNLANSRYAGGDFAGARSLHEKALEIFRHVLGEEHPSTLTSISNLAATLRAQGDLTGARRLQEKALEMQRRVLGEEHPDTLVSMNHLANTLHSQGDLAGARSLYEKALEVRRRVLGEEHPDTLTSMGNLANTRYAEGDFVGARSLLEKALEVCRHLLGEEHPLTLTSIGNLAVTLRAQGDLTGAHRLQENALEIQRRVLGEEHPDTLASMNHLANTLYSRGDSAGARSLHEKVLGIRRRVLGEEHPETLTSMGNLAETLLAQGDLAGAHSLNEKALDIRRRLLSEERPST